MIGWLIFCLYLHQFWPISHALWLVWKLRCYSIRCIIFIILHNFSDLLWAHLSEIAKHWDSTLSHYINVSASLKNTGKSPKFFNQFADVEHALGTLSELENANVLGHFLAYNGDIIEYLMANGTPSAYLTYAKLFNSFKEQVTVCSWYMHSTM